MATKKQGPTYPLSQVRALLASGKVEITRNALESARKDFNWGPTEIVAALLHLNGRSYHENPAHNHFYKSEPNQEHSGKGLMMDIYKAKKLKGFAVYTHFCINNGLLEISSFKAL